MGFPHLLLCWAEEQRLHLIAVCFCTAPLSPPYHAWSDCASCRPCFENCQNTSGQIFSPLILTLLIHAFANSLDGCVYIHYCFNSISSTSFNHFSQWLSLSFHLGASKQLIKNWSGVEQKVILPAYLQEQYSCQKHRFKVACYIPTVGDILILNSVCGPGNKPGLSV